MYRQLSVDIVDGGDSSTASVDASLSHFFQPEVREIKCEKCTEGTHASQTLRVSSR